MSPFQRSSRADDTDAPTTEATADVSEGADRQEEAAEAAAPKGPNAAFVAEVDKWFRERVHHSPLSKNTQVFNATREAVEDLKQRLANLEV